MAMLMIEKYRKILSADPSSMVFVELAKALLDHDRPDEAIECCENGLEHHPNSIIGHVLWGRALIELRRPDEAMDHFETAMTLDPNNPYAFNLIGEALLNRRLFRSALPILKRAVSLQPGDRKVRQWLEQAETAISNKEQEGFDEPDDPDEENNSEREKTDVFPTLRDPPTGMYESSHVMEDDHGENETGDMNAGAINESEVIESDHGDEDPDADENRTGDESSHSFSQLDLEDDQMAIDDLFADISNRQSESMFHELPSPGLESIIPSGQEMDRRTLKEKASGTSNVLDLLGIDQLPAPKDKSAAGPRRKIKPEPDKKAVEEESPEAKAIADKYERELRDKLLAAPVKTPPGKKQKMIMIGTASGLLVAVIVAAAIWGTITSREKTVNDAIVAARNGIARDTYAGYLAALDRLSDALRIDPENVEALSLAAFAESILYSSLDPDPKRKARVMELLSNTENEEQHRDIILNARYHISSPEEQKEIAEQVLEIIESGEGSAALHHIAGIFFMDTEDAEKATDHFNKVLQLQPAHTRTMIAVADRNASIGQWANAFQQYNAVRANIPGHGRAQTGAAKARLELNREVSDALVELRTFEREFKDSLSTGEKLKLDIVAAQLEQRIGETQSAIDRLSKSMMEHPDSALLPRLLAISQLSVFNLSEALKAIERAESLTPDDPEIKHLKARIFIKWSRYDEASSILDEIEPDPKIMLDKAIAAYHAGKFSEAREILDKTRNEEGQMPSDNAIYHGLVELASGEISAAQTVLVRTARARGEDKLVDWAFGRLRYAQENERGARHHFGNTLEHDPKHFRAYTDLARIDHAGGDYEQAADYLEKALEINPYHREALQMLAEVKLAIRDISSAMEILNRILRDHPNNPDAHRTLAIAFLERRDTDSAKKHAQTAIDNDSRNYRNHHVLSRIHMALEDYSSAISSLRIARNRNPDNSDLLIELSHAHLGRGTRNDNRLARNYIEQAIEIDSDNPSLHWRLGVLLQQTGGNRTNAISSLEKAASLYRTAGDQPRQAAVLLDLSRTYRNIGGRRNLDQARQTAAQSVRIHPTVEGHELLGIIYLAEKKPRIARTQFESAIRIDPNHASVNFHLGKLLAEQNNPERAANHLQKYLKLDPEGRHANEAGRILGRIGN